jgi:hypothetical protein
VQGTKSVIRLGLARTIIYGVYTVFLAGISPNIRSYTVYIYGSGQPYIRPKSRGDAEGDQVSLAHSKRLNEKWSVLLTERRKCFSLPSIFPALP